MLAFFLLKQDGYLQKVHDLNTAPALCPLFLYQYGYLVFALYLKCLLFVQAVTA